MLGSLLVGEFPSYQVPQARAENLRKSCDVLNKSRLSQGSRFHVGLGMRQVESYKGSCRLFF